MIEDIHYSPEFAYLEGAKAAVFLDSKGMIGNSDVVTKSVVNGSKDIEIVNRGDSNDIPVKIMENVYRNISVGANVDFNAKMAYGDGVMVYEKFRNETSNKIEIRELLRSDQGMEPVFEFIERNNVVRSIQEWANDITVFYDSYCQITFGIDYKTNPRVVRIDPVETLGSRLSKANENGVIEFHAYSPDWSKSDAKVTFTHLLDKRNPVQDILSRIGKIPTSNGKLKNDKNPAYMLSLQLPTPGQYYYGKPYWWSIFESGWFDFACAIPQFKKALISNQMVLKYHVQISSNFWHKLFAANGLSNDKNKQEELRTKVLKDLNEFLSGEKNAGKSFVSEMEYNQIKGVFLDEIKITPLESFVKGGDYIEDSEEASNNMSYAMGVHPSIIGSSPGKSKTINGTEARELFIIKQAMMKPVRDLMLLPLYVVKAINNWPANVEFAIPNIMLTTVDKGTGSIKSIGNEKV